MNIFYKVLPILSFFTIAYSKDYNFIIPTSPQISHLKNSCNKLLHNNEELPLGFKFEDYFCNNDQKAFELQTKRDGKKYMILSGAQCKKDGLFTVQIDFSDLQYVFSSANNKTLTGEGFFYKEKNSICILSDSTNFVLALWFPSKLSLKSRHSPVGKLWSKYHGFIGLKNIVQNDLHYSCSEYQYTCFNTALQLMQLDEKSDTHTKENKDMAYPHTEYSMQELMFQLTVKNSKGKRASGHATLLFINTKLYCDSPIVEPRFIQEDNFDYTNDRNIPIWNVSYSIEFHLGYRKEEIPAEGMYNTETGMLYMVGCRSSSSSTFFQEKRKVNHVQDCDVRMQIRVPHLNSKGEDRFSGKIWSSRSELDMLYFEPVEVLSHGRMAWFEMDRYESYDYVGDEWISTDGLIFVVYFALMYVFIGFLFFVLKMNLYSR